MEFFKFSTEIAIAIGDQVDKSVRTISNNVASLDFNAMDRWLNGNAEGWDAEVGYGRIDSESGEIVDPGDLQLLDFHGNPIEFEGGSIDQFSIFANFNCNFAGFYDEVSYSDGDEYLVALLLYTFDLTISCAGADENSAAKTLETKIADYFYLTLNGDPYKAEYTAISGFTPKLGHEIRICEACLFIIDPGQKFCAECGSKAF